MLNIIMTISFAWIRAFKQIFRGTYIIHFDSIILHKLYLTYYYVNVYLFPHLSPSLGMNGVTLPIVTLGTIRPGDSGAA